MRRSAQLVRLEVGRTRCALRAASLQRSRVAHDALEEVSLCLLENRERRHGWRDGVADDLRAGVRRAAHNRKRTECRRRAQDGVARDNWFLVRCEGANTGNGGSARSR